MNANQISKSLNMAPLEPLERLPVVIDERPSATTQVLEDFEVARENILDMLKTTKEAIDTTKSLAEMSQDSDYFDVLGKLLNTYQKANMELLDLQKKIRSIQTQMEGGKPKHVTNQLFIGSSADLQKFFGKKND